MVCDAIIAVADGREREKERDDLLEEREAMTYNCNFRVQEPWRVNRKSVLKQDTQRLLPKPVLGRSCDPVTQIDKARKRASKRERDTKRDRESETERDRQADSPGWPLLKCKHKRQTNGRITHSKANPSPTVCLSQIHSRRLSEVTICPETESHILEDLLACLSQTFNNTSSVFLSFSFVSF